MQGSIAVSLQKKKVKVVFFLNKVWVKYSTMAQYFRGYQRKGEGRSKQDFAINWHAQGQLLPIT